MAPVNCQYIDGLIANFRSLKLRSSTMKQLETFFLKFRQPKNNNKFKHNLSN